MEMDNTIQTLLYLLRCGLNGTAPEGLSNLDYDVLFQLSSSHSVSAMTALALEAGGLLKEPCTDAEQAKRWKSAWARTARKNILLDEERSQILQYLDDQGIWYLPLKGSILQALYPKMGMRQMADNDILFDETYRRQIRSFMESRGYKTKEFGRCHDVYLKPPFYNFEFHVSLFDEYEEPEKALYYADVKNRLKKDSDNACGYHFSDEDFYVYILAHAYKHYIHAGTGIRILLDIYVVLRAYGAGMDWAYINRELDALGIHEFETKVKSVARKLFNGESLPDLTQEEQSFLSYLAGSGVYGTKKNLVKYRLNSVSSRNGAMPVRLRYIWSRLFPDKNIMKLYYPFCRRHEWSIPAFWCYRLIRSVLFRRKNIREEYSLLNKMD